MTGKLFFVFVDSVAFFLSNFHTGSFIILLSSAKYLSPWNQYYNKNKEHSHHIHTFSQVSPLKAQETINSNSIIMD